MKTITSILILTGTGVLCAQTSTPTPPPAISITTFDVVNQHGVLNLDIAFDSMLDAGHPEDLTDSNVTILGTPSGEHLAPGRIHSGPDTFVGITLVGRPSGTDTELSVCFRVLHFSKPGDTKKYTSSSDKPVCKTAAIMTQAQAKALSDQLNAAAAKAKADKTSSEKDIFASGFVTTAGQAKTQGGADISLNNNLTGLPGANTFLTIQKTSLSGADPRHFEVGLSWRHISLFDASLDRQIDADLRKYELAGTEADQSRLGAQVVADSQKYGLWLGATEDFAIKMEGDPTQFKSANTVGDGDVQVLTRTVKLFGSANGYFRARPLIVGFEGGRSIAQGEATTTTTATSASAANVNWIARGKAGAEFTLFFHNPDATGPIKRLEINAGGVERYLFFNEVNYNSSTKKDSSIGKGSRPYFQSDVKLFFFEDSKGRYGLRMAYTRGSLPPVFAMVKSFQFGFVFETADDKSK